jgi:hypothetical protein
VLIDAWVLSPKIARIWCCSVELFTVLTLTLLPQRKMPENALFLQLVQCLFECDGCDHYMQWIKMGMSPGDALMGLTQFPIVLLFGLLPPPTLLALLLPSTAFAIQV